MVVCDSSFPYFCKLVNEKSFYYFENAQNVQEVQIMGKKAFLFSRKIEFFLDRIWLQDVFDLKDIYIPVSKEIWEEKFKLIQNIKTE